MAEDLKAASSREVLWWGRQNLEGMISHVSVAARGTESEVPALFPHMDKGDVVIHNHPSGILEPSGADLSVASLLGNRGIGFFIINNELTRFYAVAEPVKRKKDTYLDEDEMAEILSPDGALSRISANFEHRPSQTDLLRLFCRGFNEDLIIAAEAGTGVGKSFAYLIPAMKWAEENEERVVISTATINLQQQIVEKDIPLARQITGTTVKAVLVKGRRNYICHSRLKEQIDENSLFLDEGDSLKVIYDWSQISATGSRTELNFHPDEALWSRVCSESDTCTGMRCPWFENCYVMRARREAASAGILVVNHHLLFADLALRQSGIGYESGAVLPVYDRIVFDEAHNIENSATSFFSESLSKFSVNQLLSRLYRLRRGKAAGAAVRIEALSGPCPDLSEIPQHITNIKAKAEILDSLCRDFTGDSYTRRITGDPDQNIDSGVLAPMGELQKELLLLSQACTDTLKTVPEEEDENPLVFEFKAMIRRLQEMASFCEKFRNYGEYGEHVFWIERKKTASGEFFERFIITPLDIASLMNEAVFSQFKSVICTSATMTVRDSFSYWNSRVGLNLTDPERVHCEIFPSPFDYASRVLLTIPEDVPLPEEGEAYYRFISDFCGKAIEVSEGGALLLFTSYDMLRNVYDDLKPTFDRMGITAYRQGEDDRTRLLNSFRNDLSSVLFATDSFWEGVDTPGDSLKLVIICRLPFRVPTDPVVMARVESIERRGGNPFMELSVPEAVMKFKQGFGRLMRRKSDRGIVLILDSRVIKKRYGSLFLNSLPPAGRSVKAGDAILLEIENFLYGN
ncbi:MAG: DEAD/DEAH box helicase [Calditrichaeota bacterium]|nr:MAG: DEAD/DEAH box helicase [Calditrichota bacterium]